jgi:hypothetical protein
MLLGWGVFNLVEGVIDHDLLNIHHVRDMPSHVPAYDWIFLAVGGVGFSLLGLLLARESRELMPPPRVCWVAPYAHALSKRVVGPAMPQGVADPEYLTLEQIRALT